MRTTQRTHTQQQLVYHTNVRAGLMRARAFAISTQKCRPGLCVRVHVHVLCVAFVQSNHVHVLVRTSILVMNINIAGEKTQHQHQIPSSSPAGIGSCPTRLPLLKTENIELYFSKVAYAIRVDIHVDTTRSVNDTRIWIIQ